MNSRLRKATAAAQKVWNQTDGDLRGFLIVERADALIGALNAEREDFAVKMLAALAEKNTSDALVVLWKDQVDRLTKYLEETNLGWEKTSLVLSAKNKALKEVKSELVEAYQLLSDVDKEADKLEVALKAAVFALGMTHFGGDRKTAEKALTAYTLYKESRNDL